MRRKGCRTEKEEHQTWSWWRTAAGTAAAPGTCQSRQKVGCLQTRRSRFEGPKHEINMKFKLVNFTFRKQVLRKAKSLGVNAAQHLRPEYRLLLAFTCCSPRPFIHHITTEDESVGEETQLAPISSIYFLYFLSTYKDDAQRRCVFYATFFFAATCDFLSAAKQIVLLGTINKGKWHCNDVAASYFRDI